MSIDSNDPRLTAYALGEMDEQERVNFEQELDAAGRAEVEAIRALAGDLGAEMGNEPVVALSAAQRASVTRDLEPRRWPWALAALLFISASVAAVWAWNAPPMARQNLEVAKLQERDAVESLRGTDQSKPAKMPSLTLEPARMKFDLDIKQALVDQAEVDTEVWYETVESRTAKMDGAASTTPIFFTSRPGMV
ncbi:MAG: hypothetical protein ACYS0E_17850, partial [Planctomycetota bacterium]